MVLADHMSPMDIEAVDANDMHDAAIEDRLDMDLPTDTTERSGEDITETGAINAEKNGVDQNECQDKLLRIQSVEKY